MDAAPDSRTGLLDAAELLFARRGFRSTTIKAIAAAAGVNTALLYYYFPDKQGLYRAVLERAFGGLISEGESRLAGRAATPRRRSVRSSRSRPPTSAGIRTARISSSGS